MTRKVRIRKERRKNGSEQRVRPSTSSQASDARKKREGRTKERNRERAPKTGTYIYKYIG